MRFHHVIVASLALCALPSTQAFTQGQLLLPSYLCGPAVANADGTITGTDGKPKALGGVLAGLQEYTYANSKEVNVDNDFLYDPVVDPMIFLGAMHNAHAAHVTNVFHGGDRRPLPPGGLDNQTMLVIGGNPVPGNIYTGKGAAQLGPIKPYNNVTVPIKAQTNVLGVVGIPALPPAAAADVPPAQSPAPTNFTTITPNTLTLLSMGAKNNVPGQTGAANFFDPANGADIALDGAIVYAQNAKNVRIGKFVGDADGVAVPWDACGADSNGLVHAQLLSGTNVFNGAKFFLNFDYAWPKNGNPGITTFTMMGAAVSDGGFGYHQTKWQVQPLPNLALSTVNLNPGDVGRCMNGNVVPKACLASCLDCINKAGSTKKNTVFNPAAGQAAVTLTCAPDLNIGNPAMNQITIWNATCKIKNVVTPVVPAGTVHVQGPAPKDATGADMTMTTDQQMQADALAAIFNTPDSQMPPQTTCPTQANSNPVNTAATSSYSWFTTMTVALSAIFAARR